MVAKKEQGTKRQSLITEFFGTISLRTLFFVGFLALVVLPMILVNFFLNKDYKNTLSRNYTSQVVSVLNQMQISIEDEIKRLSLATSVIANDKELTADLENWHSESNKSNKFTLSQAIDKKLNYLFTYSADVNSLIIFFKDGSYYYYRRDLIDPSDKVVDLGWYKDVTNQPGRVINIGYGKSITNREDKLSTLALAIAPKAITIDNSIEVVYVDTISPTIKNISRMQGTPGNYYLLNANLEAMVFPKDMELIDFSKNSEALNNSTETYRIADERFFISALKSDKSTWYFVYIEPAKAIERSINSILSIFYLANLTLLLFLGTYVFIFYKGSIIPMNTLVKTMEKVQAGNLEVVADVTGPKEFRKLSQSFNMMMVRIKSLIRERDANEQEKLKEEIKALQAQINPHFIYNTLNTIKIMAMMSKANNIKKMLESFMKVIELNFKKKGSMMKISDEINYLEAYIHIMKARYGSFFQVKYDVETGLLNTYIMQMILQPLVENAIIHGLSDKEDGVIYITMKRVDTEGSPTLLLSICDNGSGIENEKIPELLTKPQADVNHIGISNVKRRIEITYGSKFTLNISSIKNAFTQVDILLPIIEILEDTDV
jgi:two-component system, sensor histidine kinase YesM